MADVERAAVTESSSAAVTLHQEPVEPLPPHTSAPYTKRWLVRVTDDVNLSYADIPILACCAVSGLCDSVAFNAAGVFVSMQTGQ